MTATHDNTTQHYFGSTAFTWAVGQTREEVIKKLARGAGADIIRRQVKDNGGLYAWTCLVPLPQSAPYEISCYAPVNVGAHSGQSSRIITARGNYLDEASDT